MPTTTIDLTKFCGKIGLKFSPAAPWVFNGWKYATDGRVLIRVPSDGEKSTPGEHPNAADIFTDSTKRPIKAWHPWPEQTGEATTEPCTECLGKKLDTRGCPACGGSGSEICPSCNHKNECEGCGGRGWIYTNDRCPACNGSGAQPSIPAVMVGSVSIAGKYHAMIAELPSVEYADNPYQEIKYPLPFRFAGGEGLVMGLNTANA